MVYRKIVPVILAGGKGSRLWPLSREDVPKQFCTLYGSLSLFQRTIKRVQACDLFDTPLVITNKACLELARAQLDALGCAHAKIICEPCGRDTLAAILLAIAVSNTHRHQLMMVMPSDHHIEDEAVLMKAVKQAIPVAAYGGYVVAFGITPDRAETGFGYLRAGEALFHQGVWGHEKIKEAKTAHDSSFLDGCIHHLKSFIEKPDQRRAEHLLKEENVYWNAGIFLFERESLRHECFLHALEAAQWIEKSVCMGDWHDQVFYPDAEFFTECEAISFDYAVMEKTTRAALLPVNPGWSDLGSWNALWQMAQQQETHVPDEAGNVAGEACYLHQASNCYVHSDGPVVGVAGLHDVVVVAQDDAILVTSRHNDQGVKQLVHGMKENAVMAATQHCQHEEKAVRDIVNQPRDWGASACLDKGQDYEIKRVLVHPQQVLPLKRHMGNDAHWIILEGKARVMVNHEVAIFSSGDHIHVPHGAVCGLVNESNDIVKIIVLKVKEENDSSLDDLNGGLSDGWLDGSVDNLNQGPKQVGQIEQIEQGESDGGQPLFLDIARSL